MTESTTKKFHTPNLTGDQLAEAILFLRTVSSDNLPKWLVCYPEANALIKQYLKDTNQ